jgi:hypothetical protein
LDDQQQRADEEDAGGNCDYGATTKDRCFLLQLNFGQLDLILNQAARVGGDALDRSREGALVRSGGVRHRLPPPHPAKNLRSDKASSGGEANQDFRALLK